MGYNFVADNTGLSSFVYPLLAPIIAKSREIPTKFDLTAVQGHPRSSIDRKRICDFLLVINSNCGLIYYRLRDIDA